jgi:Kef-type K+ transport system membrane component KefB
MDVFIGLMIILASARALGEAAEWLKLPSILGEVLAGVILGIGLMFWPSLPFIGGITENASFSTIIDMAIFFLMFTAGMEVRLSNLIKDSRKGAIVALGGVIVPAGLGVALGLIFLPRSDVLATQVAFLGVALAITAVPISIATLMELGKLDSTPGGIIVDAAVADDLIGIILLAVLIGMVEAGGVPSVQEFGLLGIKILGFFVFSVLFSKFVLPMVDRFISKTRSSEMHFTIVLVTGGLLAITSDLLGLHFMIGAFTGGLLIRDRMVKSEHINQESEAKLRGVTLGFLAPIFFASTGLHIDLSAFQIASLFTASILVAAIFSKFVGCSIPALLMGVPERESFAIGAGMVARGGGELVVASVALQAGLFSKPEPVPPEVSALYSAVIIMAIVSTIIAPVGLRLLLGKSESSLETRGPDSEGKSLEVSDAR